jgi:phage shock protein A
LLGRLKFLVGARAAAARRRVDGPDRSLEQAYGTQMKLLQRVRAGQTQVAAARSQLELQAQRLVDQVVALESTARQSLSAGDEERARRALDLKADAQRQLRDLDPQIATLERRQEELAADQLQLEEALARFRTENGRPPARS